MSMSFFLLRGQCLANEVDCLHPIVHVAAEVFLLGRTFARIFVYQDVDFLLARDSEVPLMCADLPCSRPARQM